VAGGGGLERPRSNLGSTAIEEEEKEEEYSYIFSNVKK
jgi:hypothetical protein